MKKIFQKIFGKTSNSIINPSLHESFSVPKVSNYSYKIYGSETQIVEINLAPFQSIALEPGSIIYMDRGITMDTSLNSGGKSTISRMLSGSSLFLVNLTYENNQGSGRISIGSNHYGSILAFNLEDQDNELYFCNNSYLCSSLGISIEAIYIGMSIGIVERKLFLQKFTGAGTVFIKGGINPQKISLGEDKTIIVSAASLLGFTSTIKYSIKTNLHPQNIISKNNFLMLSLKGPGEAYIQQSSKDSYISELSQSIISKAAYLN